MKILYFAWLRQRTGTGAEDLALPAGIGDVGGLVEYLKARSPGHAAAFAEMKAVRAAVNQEYVPLDHPLTDADEVAFFPPITGG